MWSDNDTDVDLLGFQVHSDLIRSVVTKKTMLPVTVGLFGDWGSGKSSVMRMLRRDLEKQDGVACISFNGWQFEGYDDAKTALIQSILEELKNHQRIGPKIKDKAEGLLKRVNWFRLVSVGYQTFLAPVITSYLLAQSGGTQAAAPTPETKPFAELNLDDVIEKNPANSAVENVRAFHKEFSELITETGLNALVILIDDLDRCTPERLIDTLEAIKLFLAVPHVGFIIGADPRLVRYAIATRYDAPQGDDELNSVKKTELVTDYVEKLIQIPYYLPRLAPNEIETYINMLFCQLSLVESDFGIVLTACGESLKQKRTAIFGYQEIVNSLTAQQKTPAADLETQISLSRTISPSLADILKGNPRQTKRLLNSLLLRLELAKVAGLTINPSVLVKLMVLEYVRPDQFRELYDIQARQHGTPSELGIMEAEAVSAEKVSDDKFPNTDWQDRTVLNWLRMQPPLAKEDLRDYFWLTRDRISGLLAGVSLVSPIIRTLIADLVGREGIAIKAFTDQVRGLQGEEQSILFSELGNVLRRDPNAGHLLGNWMELSNGFPEAATRLVSSLDQIPVASIPTITPLKLALVHKNVPDTREAITKLFAKWKTNTRLKPRVEEAENDIRGSK
ncbi:MAG: KAP family NTPase [Anaerolineae bacterium]|nr:KAP family NTPase [Anaerolineae bacterium]